MSAGHQTGSPHLQHHHQRLQPQRSARVCVAGACRIRILRWLCHVSHKPQAGPHLSSCLNGSRVHGHPASLHIETLLWRMHGHIAVLSPSKHLLLNCLAPAAMAVLCRDCLQCPAGRALSRYRPMLAQEPVKLAAETPGARVLIATSAWRSQHHCTTTMIVLTTEKPTAQSASADQADKGCCGRCMNACWRRERTPQPQPIQRSSPLMARPARHVPVLETSYSILRAKLSGSSPSGQFLGRSINSQESQCLPLQQGWQ